MSGRNGVAGAGPPDGNTSSGSSFNWSMYETIRSSCRVHSGSSLSGTRRRARAAIRRTTSGVTVEEREDIGKIVSRKTNFEAPRGARAGALAISPRVRERLARLASEPDLAALSRIAARRGARLWIVGGALRDLLLGRDVPEVDLATTGDGEELARAMESAGHGRAVFLSGERRPRVFRIAGRRRTLDVAELEGGSIESDLARRDFTANAIAADLASGALVDPFGGVADLAARRLRMVREENLADDPLRALRAARLFATHGLSPDRATSRACRRTAKELARVAKERVQAEIAKLLEATQAASALSWAADNGLLGPAFDLSASPRKWKAIVDALASFDGPIVARLAPERRRRLRLALLAARLGLRSREAAAWLTRLRWGTAEAGHVSRLLELARAARRLRREDDEWRWVLAAGESAPDSLRLLAAVDPRAAPFARRLSARARRARALPQVRGADVLEWLGVAPGPEVGRLLEAVRVAALAGRVRTRADARDWLKKRHSSAAPTRGLKS